jgi:hypothetical protein
MPVPRAGLLLGPPAIASSPAADSGLRNPDSGAGKLLKQQFASPGVGLIPTRDELALLADVAMTRRSPP